MANSYCQDGDGPISLIQGSSGKFYGATLASGGSDTGTVFSLTGVGTEAAIYAFGASASDASAPEESIIQGSDGNFYGTTLSGGADNQGTIFQLTPGGTVTILHSFAGGKSDGQIPFASLIQGTDGNFYGTTAQGGASTFGIAFKITAAGVFTLLHSFSDSTTDGGAPYAPFGEGTDGNFYTATAGGGSNNLGAIVKMTPAGEITLVHSFPSAATDGESPTVGLVVGPDGSFYGTTAHGGTDGGGTVYKITPGGTYAQIYSFLNPAGMEPTYGLVEGADGNFYGGADLGGTHGGDTVFKIAVSPALPAPVQLTLPASVAAGNTFNLSYKVTIAYGGTLGYCFATNTAKDTTGVDGRLYRQADHADGISDRSLRGGELYLHADLRRTGVGPGDADGHRGRQQFDDDADSDAESRDGRPVGSFESSGHGEHGHARWRRLFLRSDNCADHARVERLGHGDVDCFHRRLADRDLFVDGRLCG